jgi:hypothetical protein
MKTMRNIDYDRGVLIRVHAQTGMDIFMYADQPGVFLNAHGTEVTPLLAQQAGYDTDKLVKERKKRERMAEAMAKIEREMDGQDEVESKIVEERDGYKIMDIGLGRHNLVDPDGDNLNTIPLPLEQAKLLLDSLIPVKVQQAPAPVEVEPVVEVEVKKEGDPDGSA